MVKISLTSEILCVRYSLLHGIMLVQRKKIETDDSCDVPNVVSESKVSFSAVYIFLSAVTVLEILSSRANVMHYDFQYSLVRGGSVTRYAN